jgi:PAS domain S-box-containing protein
MGWLARFNPMTWTIDAVRGLDIRDVVPSESNREESTRIGSEVREKGERVTEEFMLRRTSGDTFPALVSLAPIFGDGDELVGTIGIYTDISELKQTERDLRFHKHAIDAVGQALVATNLDRSITYWNAAAEQMLGWKAEEVIGRDFYEIASADEFSSEMSAIGTKVRQGESWSGEFQLKHKDGRTVPVLMSVSPVLDEGGNPTQIIGAYTDITDLKHTERDIRFFKNVVDAIGEAVVATSLDGHVTYVNSAAERMLGWTADDLIGKSLLSTIPDQARIDEAREIAAYVRTGKPWFSEFSLQRKDGSTFPALISLAPVTNEMGDTTGIISVYSEISDLKKAEEENRFFKHVVDAVGQVVIANDLDRNITYWNQAAEEILGWKAEEVVGIDAATVAPTPDFLSSIPEITAVVRSGHTWVGEFPLQHRDGSIVPALTTLKPIFNEVEEIIGVLGAHTDVRALKQTEQELRFHKYIVDAVGQSVIATDLQGRIQYWNSAAERIYGWSADEVIGKPIMDVTPAAESLHLAGEIMASIVAGESWSGEFRARRGALPRRVRGNGGTATAGVSRGSVSSNSARTPRSMRVSPFGLFRQAL